MGQFPCTCEESKHEYKTQSWFVHVVEKFIEFSYSVRFKCPTPLHPLKILEVSVVSSGDLKENTT